MDENKTKNQCKWWTRKVGYSRWWWVNRQVSPRLTHQLKKVRGALNIWSRVDRIESQLNAWQGCSNCAEVSSSFGFAGRDWETEWMSQRLNRAGFSVFAFLVTGFFVQRYILPHFWSPVPPPRDFDRSEDFYIWRSIKLLVPDIIEILVSPMRKLKTFLLTVCRSVWKHDSKRDAIKSYLL